MPTLFVFFNAHLKKKRKICTLVSVPCKMASPLLCLQPKFVTYREDRKQEE